MAESFRQVLEVAFQVLGQEQAQKLADALDAVGDAGANADGKLSPLVDQFLQLADTSAKVAAAIDISDRLQKNDAALVEAKASLAALNAEFDRTDKSSAEVTIAFDQAEKRVRSLAAEQLKLQTASAQSADALKKAGIDTNDLAAAQADLKAKATGVAAKIEETGKQAASTSKQLKDAGDGAAHLGEESKKSGTILGELRDNLGKIVAVATTAAAAFKAIEFAKDGFKEAAALEETLVRVGALAGEARQSLAGFEAGIDDAAGQAGVSANIAAAAMAELVQQGRNADEALTALVPTLLLAKTAQLDVAQAAGIVDGALSQFGGTAKDAAQFVDILVSASKGSKDGIAGLTDGVQKLAPFARDLNLSFKDTVGILGFMTRNGLSAADATKGLASIFRDLKDPASDLRQQLFALGDGTGNFDTAITTLANSGERGKKAILGLDDSTRKVVLFLQQQGTQGLAQFRASLDNVAGSAAALDKAIGDNLNGAWGDFTRAIDTIGAKLAKPVLEPLKIELQSLASRLSEFAKSPAFAELQEKIRELARNGVAALDNLLRGIDWNEFINGARSAIADASSSIAAFKDNLETVGAVLSKVANVIGVVYRSIAVVFDTARIGIANAVDDSVSKLLTITQSVDGLTGGTSKATMALEALRDSARDSVDSGIADLDKNTSKLKDNLLGMVGAGNSAASGLSVAMTAARIANTAFANVQAGVASTRASLQHFDVPPGTFDNVVSGGEQAGKAMADLSLRIADAQREANAAQADLNRLALAGNNNTQAMQEAARAVDVANQRLHALQGQATAAASSAGSLATAFKTLGIVSQEELIKGDRGAEAYATALDTVWKAYQAGKATVEDVRAAFEAYAAKQLEAVKNSDAWKQQQVADALEVKKSLLGLTDIPPPKLPDFRQPKQDTKEFGDEVEKAGDSVKGIGEKSKEGAREMSSGFAQMSNIFAGWVSKFNETSRAASLRFQELTKAIFEFGVSSNTYIQADGTGIAKLGFAISEASRKTQAEIDEQKKRVQELSAQYQGMTAEAIAAMSAQQGSAEALARSLEAQAAAAREGQSGLELLGASDLSPLASALDGVAAKARQLAEQAQSARESFADLASSLEEQIAQQQGDLARAEDVRFQNQLEQLRKQAEESNTLGSAEYSEAVARANELHNLKMKQLQEQAEAKRKSDEEEAARKRELEKPNPNAPAPTETKPVSSGGDLGTIRVELPNGQTRSVRGTRETAQDLFALMRELQRQASLQPEKR